MISTLIYSSNSLIEAHEFASEMRSIRQKAEKHNRLNGITGFLFSFDQKFIQIIEGEFEAVTAQFARIRRDERHDKVRILWFSENEERAFADWSMDCSMAYAVERHMEMSVKLSFLSRFISDTSQPQIRLRDLLVDIAQAMQRRTEFPRPELIAAE